jgi:hypothetical protein
MLIFAEKKVTSIHIMERYETSLYTWNVSLRFKHMHN